MYTQFKSIYENQISQIKKEGLFKEERQICSQQGAQVQVQFHDENTKVSTPREMINLCSNNYLGLSSHPELIKAAHKALDDRGYGMSSVRFICGTQDLHCELENKVSSFLGMEDSILFSSCFDANGALFEGLLTQEDVLFSDKLVHASLIDGMRLCKAEKHIFEHSDLGQLEEQLKNSKGRVRMIITDGVFSMDGDMARLDELCSLSEKYNAMLAVDDSHATGFIGKSGRGTHEFFNVMDRVDIITTTFGKALGGATGGVISGKKELITLLKQRGRPYLFSNALPPSIVAGTLKAIDLISSSTERRDHLENLTGKWRKGLTEAGFDLKSGNTPIVPIMLYNANLAQLMSRELSKEGVFAIGFFYPVVAKGQARIRTQMSAALNENLLNQALRAFIKVGKKLDILGKSKEELASKIID